jgi:hypothetical protein
MGPPEYEAAIQTTLPRRSVRCVQNTYGSGLGTSAGCCGHSKPSDSIIHEARKLSATQIGLSSKQFHRLRSCSDTCTQGHYCQQHLYWRDREKLTVLFSWRWGGSSNQAWMPTYVCILRITHMMSLESDGGMIYCQGKTEELGEKPVPVPLCPPQIPHGLT